MKMCILERQIEKIFFTKYVYFSPEARVIGGNVRPKTLKYIYTSHDW